MYPSVRDPLRGRLRLLSGALLLGLGLLALAVGGFLSPNVEGSHADCSTPAFSPIVVTDKPDYFSGETVHIEGCGFQSYVGQSLPLSVTRPDSAVDSTTVLIDGSGNFTYNYLLDGILGNYLVEVWNASHTTVLASMTFTDGDIDFNQCRNDSDNNNIKDDCAWTTGGINANDGIYAEGDGVPQRLFHQIDDTGTHTMGFEYDFSNADIYKYDFLTNVDATMAIGASELNECGDLPNFLGANAAARTANCTSLFSGPDANTALVDVPSDPFDSVASRENPPGAGARDVRVGCSPVCTSISASLEFPDAADGGPTDGEENPGGEAHIPDSDPDCFQNCGSSAVRIHLTFTTASVDTFVGVWFAGHLAQASDPAGTPIGWGTGFGASTAPGAQFHLKYVCLREPGDNPCGQPSTSVGSRDNQIQLKGVEATATPTNTPVPPTSTPTNTPITPTNTPTNTPNTPTNTPITPTNTPITPTNTPTNTPITPTNTPTNTPVTPTNTPTNTPITPTNTPTNTPVTPTNTPTSPPVEATPTRTNTPPVQQATATPFLGTPGSVGGVSFAPPGSSSSGGGDGYGAAAAVIAAVAGASGAAWYVRRRQLR